MSDFERIEALLKQEAAYDTTEASIELGGQTIRIFAKPLTGLDIEKARRKQADFTSNPGPEAMIDLIIAKARNDDGSAMFSLKHKPFLQRVKVEKIATLFGELFGSQLEAPTEDEAEERVKN